jgi:hypothetical protein
MDSGYITVIINSSDPSVTGDAADFYAEIPSLELIGEWECCLLAANFPKSTVGNSVYIFLDILENQPIGNSLFPLLARIPPIHGTDSDPIVYELTSTVVPWKKVITSNISQIHAELVESTGVPIPSGAGKFTTIEMVFRRVG